MVRTVGLLNEKLNRFSVAESHYRALLAAMDNPRQIAFAPSSTSGLVVWTVENFVKGWYLRQDVPD